MDDDEKVTWESLTLGQKVIAVAMAAFGTTAFIVVWLGLFWVGAQIMESLGLR